MVVLDNGDSAAAAKPWEPPENVVTLETQHLIEVVIGRGINGGPWSPRISEDARSVKHVDGSKNPHRSGLIRQ